jgi:hypothetical protein
VKGSNYGLFQNNTPSFISRDLEESQRQSGSMTYGLEIEANVKNEEAVLTTEPRRIHEIFVLHGLVYTDVHLCVHG